MNTKRNSQLGENKVRSPGDKHLGEKYEEDVRLQKEVAVAHATRGVIEEPNSSYRCRSYNYKPQSRDTDQPEAPQIKVSQSTLATYCIGL